MTLDRGEKGSVWIDSIWREVLERVKGYAREMKYSASKQRYKRTSAKRERRYT